MKKVSLTIKVDPRFKRALEKCAKSEQRSVANYVKFILNRHLKRKGINWEKLPAE